MEPLDLRPIEYGGIDANDTDPILNDDLRLERAAALAASHQAALKDVIDVLMAQRAFYLVHKADPDDVLPVRHELAALTALYDRLEQYKVEHEKRRAKKQAVQAQEGDKSSSL